PQPHRRWSSVRCAVRFVGGTGSSGASGHARGERRYVREIFGPLGARRRGADGADRGSPVDVDRCALGSATPRDGRPPHRGGRWTASGATGGTSPAAVDGCSTVGGPGVRGSSLGATVRNTIPRGKPTARTLSPAGGIGRIGGKPCAG